VVKNVDHALEVMGFEELCRNNERKSGKGNRTEGEDVMQQKGERFLRGSSVEIEDASTDEDEEQSTSSYGLSLHREIYTPLVWLQQQDPSSLVPELMPAETDEDALQHELSEEEELDRCDREAQRTYEAELRDGYQQ
jgi:hypothetical protein